MTKGERAAMLELRQKAVNFTGTVGEEWMDPDDPKRWEQEVREAGNALVIAAEAWRIASQPVTRRKAAQR